MIHRIADDPVPALVDDRHDSRLPRSRKLYPRNPKKFVVEKVGNGVRAKVTDWSEASDDRVGSAATSYLVYWAETVDTSTSDGVQAGFARATLLSPAIPAPNKQNGQATAFYSDPQYLTGYFYCVGVDAEGRRSSDGDAGAPMPVVITTGTGGSVPPDVEHFAASESGEQHDLMTFSAVAYSFRIPIDGGQLVDRVQFYFKNYPNLGQLSEGESVRVTVGKGGTQTGKLQLPVGRRIGTGTVSVAGGVVTGVGTAFLSQFAAGDYFEAFGYRSIVTVVTDNTHITLSSWPASYPTVSGVATWYSIASVTIYAVSIGVTGARRDDVTNAPSQTVVLDGLLSAPVAPSITVTPIGNAIRIIATPPAGTQLARILLYRATGSAIGFSKSAYDVIKAWEIDTSNPSPTFQFDDQNFTTYQRENGQIFSYVATAVNAREQESSGSTEVDGTCRLDSPADGGGTVPARFVSKNLLWNGMLSGTPGAVSAADAVQDSNMGIAAPAGFNRWVAKTAGAGSSPAFQNTTEVLLAIAGALGSSGSSILSQGIGAWDNATAGKRRVPKGKMVTIQFKARHSAGTVDGTLNARIYQFNGAALTGSAKFKKRLPDDSLDFSTGVMSVDGANITDVHQLYWGAFLLDDSVTTTDLELQIYYDTTNYSGVNLAITEVMLSLGDGLPYWSGEIDPNTTYQPVGGGVASPPGTFQDRYGFNREYIPIG